MVLSPSATLLTIDVLKRDIVVQVSSQELDCPDYHPPTKRRFDVESLKRIAFNNGRELGTMSRVAAAHAAAVKKPAASHGSRDFWNAAAFSGPLLEVMLTRLSHLALRMAERISCDIYICDFSQEDMPAQEDIIFEAELERQSVSAAGILSSALHPCLLDPSRCLPSLPPRSRPLSLTGALECMPERIDAVAVFHRSNPDSVWS